MALSEQTRSYETMVRHHADGTVGAHHQTITEILRDKVVIQATVNEPQPLAVVDGQNGLKLSEVLGEAATLALKDNERLTGEAAASALALEQVQKHIANLEISANEQAVRITEYERQINEYTTQASELRAQIALLKDQLGAVTEEVASE